MNKFRRTFKWKPSRQCISSYSLQNVDPYVHYKINWYRKHNLHNFRDELPEHRGTLTNRILAKSPKTHFVILSFATNWYIIAYLRSVPPVWFKLFLLCVQRSRYSSPNFPANTDVTPSCCARDLVSLPLWPAQEVKVLIKGTQGVNYTPGYRLTNHWF